MKSLILFSLFSFLLSGDLAFAAKAECSSVYSEKAPQPILSGNPGFAEQELKTTDPFGLLPENQFKVTIIKSVPNQVVKDSGIAWLKDADSLALVKSILQRGVPLVRGQIPDGTTADAFVLPAQYQMTLDILKAKQDDTHKNILFLQDHATVDVIAHELQHWNDYEDGTFNKFITQLQSLKKTAKLSENELSAIQDAVVELRGHARQELTLMANPQTNDPESLALVENNYRHYAEALIPILNRLKKASPSSCQNLLDLLKKFEIDGKMNLRFTVLLANFYKP